MKTIEDYFRDWEGHVFGFGYGTGEPYVLFAVKEFLSLCNRSENGLYDYRVISETLGETVTWLLINQLCRDGLIDYGSSPRFGWLTPQGLALKEFMSTRTYEELAELTSVFSGDIPPGGTEPYYPCYPNHCNCVPPGGHETEKCKNPFWVPLTTR